jgi:cytochrome P450
MHCSEFLSRQPRVVLLAGHETTANTLAWTALELSKHPEAQRKLREEIHATEEKIRERGDTDLTTQDLDSMPYLNAVIKVRYFFPLSYCVWLKLSGNPAPPPRTSAAAKKG